MPVLFPEGNRAAPEDDKARSYKKWNALLFNTFGNIGSVPFPEGTSPSASDDADRSAKKIDAILNALKDSVSLRNGLVAYWQLDEASGTRVDATGRGNNLADGNSTLSAAGKISNAANFVSANSQTLSHADNADLKFSGDFTIACWVYLGSKTADMAAVSKYGFGGAAMDNFVLTYDMAADRFRQYFADGTANGYVLAYANNFGSPPTGQWIFVCTWRAGTEIFISVNNGIPDVVDASSQQITVFGTADFNISGVMNSVVIYWDGRIDETGKWNRALNAAERTRLYNGGVGLSYNNF